MKLRIDVYNHNFDDITLSNVLEQSLLTNKNLQTIMASNADLTAKLDELQASIDDKQAELETNNATLKATNEALTVSKTALEAELANSVNPEQTQAAIAKVDAAIADIKSTLSAPPVDPVV